MKRSKKKRAWRDALTPSPAFAPKGPLRLFLDDMRPAPEGWTLVTTAADCIAVLDRERANVVELSLDHDLAREHYAADDPETYREATGMAVVDWMIANSVWPPIVHVHSLIERRFGMAAKLEEHAAGVTTIILKPRIV